MNLHTYQHDIAIRTLNHHLGPQTQLANLTLGIVGEFAEVLALHEVPTVPNKEDIKDEGGDIMWYLANMCNVLTLELNDYAPQYTVEKPVDPEHYIHFAAIHYGKIADIVKKTIAQGHVLDIESIIANLYELVHIMAAIFAYYDLTIGEVCTYNHAKLLKRYPDGFEAAKSVNRDEV